MRWVSDSTAVLLWLRKISEGVTEALCHDVVTLFLKWLPLTSSMGNQAITKPLKNHRPICTNSIKPR